MCGINGFVFQAGVARDKNMMDQIKFLFDELMVETQARGHHATGLVSVKRDGSYELYKAPKSATEVTTGDERFQGVVDNFDNDTSFVIAHTRYYTKGKPENNLNNHPFDIGNILGVHNGTVANDDHLFTQNKDNFKRIAEVDSEIVYQLINHHNPEEITSEGLTNALEKTYLRGLFALVFAHKNDPSKVHIVKQEKPMSLAYWKEAGLVIFNSQDDFIKTCFARLQRSAKRWGFDTEVTVEYLTMKDDTYITIDANATEKENIVSDPQKMYILSSATKSYYGGKGTNSYSGSSCSTGSKSTSRPTKASDSVGRVIEGELDEVTGEVTIFKLSQIAGASESNADTNNDKENDTQDAIACSECNDKLSVEEIDASYNEGAKHNNTYVCKSCYNSALNSVLQTS